MAIEAPLSDSFGRAFSYLRLSLTEVCNFRCVYCLPNGYHRGHQRDPLTVDEIRRLCLAFAELGFWKMRLTGGEPTVRQDFLDVARTVAGTSGVKLVALSTNGYRLRTLLPDLVSAGVRAVNISVDSLDRERFIAATGQDKLHEVLAAVDASLAAGLTTKLNAVLMSGPSELEAFLAFIEQRPVSVRFIELMQTGENAEIFARGHVSSSLLVEALEQRGFTRRARRDGEGPAAVFAHPQFAGTIGVIAPYGADFCQSCNRLRISSEGALRLCLFGDNQLSLRHLLQHDDQKEELQALVRRLIGVKQVSHFLHRGEVGETPNLSVIGG